MPAASSPRQGGVKAPLRSSDLTVDTALLVPASWRRSVAVAAPIPQASAQRRWRHPTASCSTLNCTWPGLVWLAETSHEASCVFDAPRSHRGSGYRRPNSIFDGRSTFTDCHPGWYSLRVSCLVKPSASEHGARMRIERFHGAGVSGPCAPDSQDGGVTSNTAHRTNSV